MTEIGELFFLPLYNFDDQALQYMARVYLDGQALVSGITVQTEFNEILFDEVHGEKELLLKKTKTLSAKKRKIGSITLYFSDQSLRQQQQQTLWTGLLTILTLLCIILSSIGIFTKIWLEQPLQLLTTGIRRIAAGDYSTPLPPAPQEELNAIVREVNIMGEKIAGQTRQLEKSEKQYRSIFEGAMEGIFRETHTGALLTVNSAMAHIFGYDTPETFLQSCSETTQHLYAQPKERKQLVETLKASGFVTSMPLQMKHRDGHTITIAMTARLVKDTENNRNYIEGSLSDITRQQQMEDELRQSQKMEAIGTLAGGIAHDFNNILSALFGYIELAQLRAKEDVQLNNYLKNALAGARRAKDLVQQILTFSRKGEQQKNTFAPAVVIQEAYKLLRSSIPPTIDILVDIRSQEIIFADPTQIHQVIINLCTNSYQAMEESGGTIHIRLYDEQIVNEDQTIDTSKTKGNVILEITDTGTGINPKTLEKIFEPYFTTKPLGKGTGLGLATVHGIVRNSQGTIDVNSTPGEGTTFRITLPAVDHSGNALQTTEPAPLPRGSGQKIMLLDDEEQVRDILGSFLEESGYVVHRYAMGQDALDALRQEPGQYDLLITDMAMPKMTGAEFARAALKIDPNVPIILCTGYSADLSYDQAKEIGICSVLQKPVQRKQFLRTIFNTLTAS